RPALNVGVVIGPLPFSRRRFAWKHARPRAGGRLSDPSHRHSGIWPGPPARPPPLPRPIRAVEAPSDGPGACGLTAPFARPAPDFHPNRRVFRSERRLCRRNPSRGEVRKGGEAPPSGLLRGAPLGDPVLLQLGIEGRAVEPEEPGSGLLVPPRRREGTQDRVALQFLEVEGRPTGPSTLRHLTAEAGVPECALPRRED